jgi:hypothetical protein
LADLRQTLNRHSFLERSDGVKRKLYFDAVTRRTDAKTARVSKHPVENGFIISDHVLVENTKLSVEGIISNANNSILNRAVGIISDQESARQFLNEVFNARKVVTLVTPEQAYDNLIITSLQFTKDKPTKQEIKFSLRLEEIRTVVSRTALVPSETVDKSVLEAVQNENKSGKASTSSISDVGNTTALQRFVTPAREALQVERFLDNLLGSF